MSATFFVTGATGSQGGAVARELLAQGHQVNALVRDETSGSAKSLRELGATLVPGSFDDITALNKAADGCHGVFLNTIPTQPSSIQVQHAKNVLDAALSKGVQRVVVASVVRAEDHESFLDYPDGLMHKTGYWQAKVDIQELAQDAGFESWTILQPAWLMTNWIAPMSDFYWPTLKSEKRMVAAYGSDTRVNLTAPEDMGKFAAKALADPAREGSLSNKIVQVVGDQLTAAEIASAMSGISGVEVKMELRSDAEIEDLKSKDILVSSQNWERENKGRIDMDESKHYGLMLSSFREFLQGHKDRLMEAVTQ